MIEAFGKLLYSKRAKLDFADKVTDALHGIHECRCGKFGDTMNPQFSSWLECYEPFMNDVYSAAKQLSEDTGSSTAKNSVSACL